MINYEILPNGIIHQKNKTDTSMIYDANYAKKYDKYINNGLSQLRLGVLLGCLKGVTNSILDVGYGNGDFLNFCTRIIPDCTGYDVSNYPLPSPIKMTSTITSQHYDVITFFDSLEHMENINIVGDLICDYIFVSVPWCHSSENDWFLSWYHRRPNEHLWHFSKESLISFFSDVGYDCIFSGNFEDIIRQNPRVDMEKGNILSCIFKKVT